MISPAVTRLCSCLGGYKSAHSVRPARRNTAVSSPSGIASASGVGTVSAAVAAWLTSARVGRSRCTDANPGAAHCLWTSASTQVAVCWSASNSCPQDRCGQRARAPRSKARSGGPRRRRHALQRRSPEAKDDRVTAPHAAQPHQPHRSSVARLAREMYEYGNRKTSPSQDGHCTYRTQSDVRISLSLPWSGQVVP